MRHISYTIIKLREQDSRVYQESKDYSEEVQVQVQQVRSQDTNLHQTAPQELPIKKRLCTER